MYITPHTTIHTTFADIQNFFKDGPGLYWRENEPLTAAELTRAPRNLIVGEPGIGKTLLLEQIRNELTALGHPADFLRLKDETVLAQALAFAEAANGGAAVLLLDALDEVGTHRLPDVLRALDDLSSKYPAVTLCVSSRWVFINRYADSFHRYRFITISPFTYDQGCANTLERPVRQIPRSTLSSSA